MIEARRNSLGITLAVLAVALYFTLGTVFRRGMAWLSDTVSDPAESP